MRSGVSPRRGHHVGARHHDLAGEGVAQLEHGPDHPALLVLDDVRLADPLDHLPQLLLVHGRRPGPGSTRAAQPSGPPAVPPASSTRPDSRCHRRADRMPRDPSVRGLARTSRNATRPQTATATSSDRPPGQVPRRDDQRDADGRRHLGERAARTRPRRDPRGCSVSARTGPPVGVPLAATSSDTLARHRAPRRRTARRPRR